MNVNELIADVIMRDERLKEKEAIGWLVVCVDDEDSPPSTPFAYGPWPTREDAFLVALTMDEVDKDDGTTGWRHVVVPMYQPNRV